MGPGQNFFTRVGSFFAVQVGSAASGSGKFPLKIPNFTRDSLRVKKYPRQKWVSPLFTAGHKYAWVRSGPTSSQTGYFSD